MSNIKIIIEALVDKFGSYRLAEKETGIDHCRLFRLAKDAELIESNINMLETVRKTMKMSKTAFWGKLTGE